MSFDSIHPAGIFAGTFLLLLVAIELGFRLGCAIHRKRMTEKESPVAAIAGTVLGLAGFLLAFTFGIVWGRYDDRRDLILTEANVIGTAWLRTNFLPEPERTESRKLMQDYLALRVQVAQMPHYDLDQMAEPLSETSRIQERLWDIAVENGLKDVQSEVSALYVEAINDLIDIHSLRTAAGTKARVPLGIWILLSGVTVLGMGALGYQTGIAESSASKSRPVLALAFAMVIGVIAALDRPVSQLITVRQDPLIELYESFKADSDSPTSTPDSQEGP